MTGLTDERDYFLLTETERLQKQLDETKSQLNTANTQINGLLNDVTVALEGIAEVYEMVLDNGSTTTSTN